MPVYEYACENCDNAWEETQKINDPKIEKCPKCKELKAKRLISGGTSFKLGNGGKVGWGSSGYATNK